MSKDPTLEDAISLAVKHHKGQTDKGGHPYILHPLRIMFRMENEFEMIVAVLHDIVEDTPITLQDLTKLGYNSMIVTAIDCLSKRDNESYNQFVDRTMTDPLASSVKLADIEDNMDTSRLNKITEKDKKRLKKYKQVHDKITQHLKDQENKECKHCLEPPM